MYTCLHVFYVWLHRYLSGLCHSNVMPVSHKPHPAPSCSAHVSLSSVLDVLALGTSDVFYNLLSSSHLALFFYRFKRYAHLFYMVFFSGAKVALQRARALFFQVMAKLTYSCPERLGSMLHDLLHRKHFVTRQKYLRHFTPVSACRDERKIELADKDDCKGSRH